MRSPFYTFWNTKSIPYSVIREGKKVRTYKGLPNNDASGRYIGFPADYDIAAGDILVPNSNEKFYVIDTLVDYWDGEPSQKKAYIKTEVEFASSQPQATTIFNIGTANGSVIGTQANVTFSYNESIKYAKKQIDSTESPDKQELHQIISLLEMVVNNQVPPQKGLFSKFSAVMERNSWITSTIATTLLNWLMSQT